MPAFEFLVEHRETGKEVLLLSLRILLRIPVRRILLRISFLLRIYKLWFYSYSDSVEIPTIDTDVMRFKFENISTSTTSEGLVYTPSSDLCPVPSEYEEVDWNMVGKGIALSMGQGIAI